MYIYGASFDCASFLRKRKPQGYSAPIEHVNACIDKVKDKGTQLACLYWFMHCMCCDYGDCTDYQKKKGWSKGHCPSEESGGGSGGVVEAGESTAETSEGMIGILKKYWWIGLIGVGALIFIRKGD
jgi:hypothetical protein